MTHDERAALFLRGDCCPSKRAAECITCLAAAFAEIERETIERCAKVAEAEPEPSLTPSAEERAAAEAFGAALVGHSAVVVTKRNIARHIRALVKP